MKTMVLSLIVLTATATASLAGPIYAEVADAGQTPGTAQTADSGTGGPLTTITGNIASSGNADAYRIYISNPSAFSATTSGTPGTLTDTQLFLFRENGVGLLGNDDGGAALRAVLPVGSLSGANAPGWYLLAISGYDNDPVDSGGNLIFQSFPFPPVYGPIDGDAFVGFASGGGTGTYTINLTGVANTPEPATLAVFGGIALAGALGYRRRKATATA
jgi:hypothetical protein